MTLHRWMLRLGLAAATLLALAPSVGRLAGEARPMASHAMHSQVAQVPGHGGHAHGGDRAPSGPTAPVPSTGGQFDCGYCPLLASLVPSAIPRIGVAEGFLEPLVRLRAAAVPTSWRHPSGLGSRGPPAA